MNKRLDIKRLGRLIIYDNRSCGYIHKVILVGVAILSIVLIMRAIHFITATDGSFMLRPIFGGTNTLVPIILGLSPFIVYGSMVKKGKNILRVMLPASSLEKYLAMLANTFITAPIIITLTAMCINIIATGFSFEYIRGVFAANGLLNLIAIIWGYISMNTFFLLILNRYRVWIGVLVIIATFIVEFYSIGALLDYTYDGYIAPSYLPRVFNIIAIVNIFVFQILVYCMNRKTRV